MSKLLEHATALYHALDAAATTETLDGEDTRVFRGSIVRVYRSLDISQAHYSEVRRGLLEANCMTILQRGSKHNPTVIVLHKEPDESSMVSYETLGLTNEVSAGIVLQELRDMRRRIGSIMIPDALINIERRLQELDKRITAIEQRLNINQTRGR